MPHKKKPKTITGRRKDKTNPRQIGTSPRQLGVSPRQIVNTSMTKGGFHAVVKSLEGANRKQVRLERAAGAKKKRRGGGGSGGTGNLLTKGFRVLD
jgi:hypothetical protein